MKRLIMIMLVFGVVSGVFAQACNLTVIAGTSFLSSVYNDITERLSDNHYLMSISSRGEWFVGWHNFSVILHWNRPDVDGLGVFFNPGLRLDCSFNKAETPVYNFVEGEGFTTLDKVITIEQRKFWLSLLGGSTIHSRNWAVRMYALNPGVEFNNFGKGSVEFCFSQFIQVCVKGFTLEIGWNTNWGDPKSYKETWDTYAWVGLGWTL